MFCDTGVLWLSHSDKALIVKRLQNHECDHMFSSSHFGQFWIAALAAWSAVMSAVRVVTRRLSNGGSLVPNRAELSGRLVQAVCGPRHPTRLTAKRPSSESVQKRCMCRGNASYSWKGKSCSPLIRLGLNLTWPNLSYFWNSLWLLFVVEMLTQLNIFLESSMAKILLRWKAEKCALGSLERDAKVWWPSYGTQIVGQIQRSPFATGLRMRCVPELSVFGQNCMDLFYRVYEYIWNQTRYRHLLWTCYFKAMGHEWPPIWGDEAILQGNETIMLNYNCYAKTACM